LVKPSAEGKHAPEIRGVKVLDVQKSGLPVRNGIANNADIVRVDVFTDGVNYFAVPLYVSDAAEKTLPEPSLKHKDGAKPSFCFSICKNDWVEISKSDGTFAGYFLNFDSSDSRFRLTAHDRNSQQGGKDGFRVSTKTQVKNIAKYHVDLFGNLHRVHAETRQPLRHKGK
jgi:CRISPR-associated endonuclease Csn1